jgi:hypothetical protein
MGLGTFIGIKPGQCPAGDTDQDIAFLGVQIRKSPPEKFLGEGFRITP